MLVISLTLASRSCRDPSPLGQGKEVTTVGSRVVPTPPEASSSKERATSSELRKEGSFQEMGGEASPFQAGGSLPAAVTMALWTCSAVLTTTGQNQILPPVSPQLDREVGRAGRGS